MEIGDELTDRLRRPGEARNRSSNWLLREAIQQYVTREECRDDFKAEAVASWTAYRQTGRHLTGEETWAWLRTWGQDDETNLPA